MKPFQDCTLIFGGTFDPPHLGHLEAVVGLFSEPGTKQIIVLPSGDSPLKSTHTDGLHRTQMVRIQFEDGPFRNLPITIDDREVLKTKAGLGKTPTYQTLLEMTQERSGQALGFVIGTDQLLQMEQWVRFPDVLKLCHWVVLNRKPLNREPTLEKLKTWEMNGWVQTEKINDSQALFRIRETEFKLGLFYTEARAISSSEIRAQIAQNGAPPEGALLPEVNAYLKLQRLYGTR